MMEIKCKCIDTGVKERLLRALDVLIQDYTLVSDPLVDWDVKRAVLSRQDDAGIKNTHLLMETDVTGDLLLLKELRDKVEKIDICRK